MEYVMQPWEENPDKVAYEYLTAGGANTPEHLDKIFEENSDPSYYVNCAFNEWTMYVTEKELFESIIKFIVYRPDKEED